MGVLAKAAGSLWDWIEAGYPEEVAKRIVSGELPMDEASRMARASEQGYGDVLWRGHALEDMPTSNSDLWASPDRSVAETYAGLRAVQSPTFQAGLTSLRTNADNLAEVNGRGAQWKSVQTNPRKLPGLQVADPDINRPLKGTDDIAEAVKGSGNYQGTLFRNTKDDAVKMRGNEATDTYNILGSRPDVKIRDTDAAYDPQYTGPNIMGNATVPALGVLATGTGAALAAPALKSEGLEKATGFLDETIRSARHAAGPLSFLVPYEGISNFAKKWNADEDLTWRDYVGLLDF